MGSARSRFGVADEKRPLMPSWCSAEALCLACFICRPVVVLSAAAMAGTVSTAAGGPQASRQPLRNTGTRPAGPRRKPRRSRTAVPPKAPAPKPGRRLDRERAAALPLPYDIPAAIAPVTAVASAPRAAPTAVFLASAAPGPTRSATVTTGSCAARSTTTAPGGPASSLSSSRSGDSDRMPPRSAATAGRRSAAGNRLVVSTAMAGRPMRRARCRSGG